MTHALAAALMSGAVAPAQPASVDPRRGKSSVSNPVAIVWAIVAANPTLSRSQQAKLATDAGVAYYTARTQIQEARKAQRLEALAAAAKVG